MVGQVVELDRNQGWAIAPKASPSDLAHQPDNSPSWLHNLPKSAAS